MSVDLRLRCSLASAMALSISGTPVVVPAECANAAAIFKELGVKFKLDDKVVAHLLEKIQLASFEEFAHLATKEEEFT